MRYICLHSIHVPKTNELLLQVQEMSGFGQGSTKMCAGGALIVWHFLPRKLRFASLCPARNLYAGIHRPSESMERPK